MNEFDIKALSWDDNPLFVERSKAIAESILQHVKLNKEMDAFEYGCGTGMIGFNLMPYLKSVCFADSSDGMLEVLKQKIIKYGLTTTKVIKTDLIVDEIPEKKFDLIFTALTLHHIVDVESILNKFYGMLKSSAFLCIADLDKENGDFHGDNFEGHKGFERDEMKKLFEDAGFVNVKVDTCYNIIKVSEQGEELTYPVFMMSGEKK